MIDLGSLSRTHSFWINDDSTSDDRNRRLRLAANHFLPAHYLQNAFLPFGCGAAPPQPVALDPNRLLTYVNGVLQIGQGLAYYDDSVLPGVGDIVDTFKQIRFLMDPMSSRYFRLFEQPDTNPIPHGVDLTATVGWLYESSAQRTGVIFLARQSQSTQATSTVFLRRPEWNWFAPAPGIVLDYGQPGHKPTFQLKAGNASLAKVVVAPDGSSVSVTFGATDVQVLLSYTY